MAIRTTKLTIREDLTTSISSTHKNANLNAMGFNMDLISKKDPRLANQIINLYEKAYNVGKK